MKLCLACNERYESSILRCPACGVSPTIIDGFRAYAPEFTHSGGGFNPNYFADLIQREESSFWFTSRNRLIVWALEKYRPNLDSFLEVGCGTGFVLTAVSNAFPQATLYGSEIFTVGLSIASARLPTAGFMQMDARRIPYIEEFDAIGAFDVLEHIEEDEQVLAQIASALQPLGILLLTVPQHPWLWSAVDERACHVRRYTAAELHRKIEMAGLQILHSTSFVSVLLPAMFASRFLQKKNTKDRLARAELAISPRLNSLFSGLLCIELALIKIGFRFPVGGSRLIIARKA